MRSERFINYSSTNFAFLSVLLYSAIIGTPVTNAQTSVADRPTSEAAQAVNRPTQSWTIQGQLTIIDTWTAASPLSGVVEEILVSEGNQVEQRQPLARLNDSLLRAELTAAQAAQKAALIESDQQVDIEYAQMTAAVRKAELQRSQLANQLHAKAVSSIELERQQLLVRQAELSAEQSLNKQRVLEQHYAEKSALVDLIQAKMAKSLIQSRIKGTVVEIAAKSGQWLSEGAPLLRVINRDRLRFESLIDIALSQQLKPGQPVRFTLTLPKNPSDKVTDQPIVALGKLTFISPEVNAVTSQVRIMAEIDNGDLQLQPGMTGQLEPLN